MARRFEKRDMPALNSWYAARGLPEIVDEALPGIGFIVEGVAAGFLYRTDAPGLAIIDGLVASPSAPLRARHAAVVDIIGRLCDEAKERRISRVIGFSEKRSVERICDRMGFRMTGLYAALGKGL